MLVYFEELSARKRAGGIETACADLSVALRNHGIAIQRSSQEKWLSHHSIPELVHFHGIWSPNLALQFIKWSNRGIPCVISTHGMLSDWALNHKRYRKRFAWKLYQKRILNSAAAIHVTSSLEAERLRDLGLKTEIVTIPWGVNTSTNTPPNSDSLPILPFHERRTAIFIGRLCPIKGLPLLIDAWKRISPPGWILKIIGPDEANYQQFLERKVANAGLEQIIEFAGPLYDDALRAVYANTELLILPSYSENFGMVVAESLYNGVPVITTHGTPWRRIAETDCGWWTTATIDGIAEALKQATSMTKAELAEMGRKGTSLITREFSFETMIKKFLDFYQSCIRARETIRGK